MFIDLTAEQRKLRDELRSYFTDLVTPEEQAEMAVNRHGDAYRAVVRRMGGEGWLGVDWPKEYGGQRFGPVEQQIFFNEAVRADVPLPLVTLNLVVTFGVNEIMRELVASAGLQLPRVPR